MPIAVVTGASRGFGRALAVDLAKDGWTLVVDARRRTALEETAAQLRSFGVEVRALAGDVADPRHRIELSSAIGELGGLDLLVLNASTLGESPLPHLSDYPLSALRQVFEVNVLGPVALVQLLLPSLRARRGAVVAVTSDAAVEPYEGWGGYGASKAALEQLHHVLEVEEPDVLVYRFDPGDMRTEMHQQAFPGEDISDRPEPESVVPALRGLLEAKPASGRYEASEWRS